MTPLAYRVLKELTVPEKLRRFRDNDDVLNRMGDIHCFDLSQVIDVMDMISIRSTELHQVDERTSFLPAPKTWIEAGKILDGNVRCRVGWLLEQNSVDRFVRVTACFQDNEKSFGSSGCGYLQLGTVEQPRYQDACGVANTTVILAALSIINTPRIIGRSQHMPHRGLERRLLAARSRIGHFPLNAWTEIKLNVCDAPSDASDQVSNEAHLTGERALHFCRAHLRVRLGRLEIVRSHWRGDPALGIKQSRYKIVA